MANQDQPKSFSESVLVIPCDGSSFPVPRDGSWAKRKLYDIWHSLRERAGLPLGARVGIRGFYRSFLRHYSGQAVFLLPTPSAEKKVRLGLERLRSEISVHPGARVCSPQELLDSRGCALHWFDPSGITSELFDFRQTYFQRPMPITCTHHSISYRTSLSDCFAPLLFANTLPCDSIVCSSRAARRAISNILELLQSRLGLDGSFYRGRLDVIPHGVEPEEFRPIEKRGCRLVFQLPADATIFLSLGRVSVTDKADLMPLVLAFKQVKRQLRKYRPLLVIAGNSRGSYLRDFQRELEKHELAESVRFIRNIAESEKPYLYNAADVFVSPSDSIQECFGLVVIEAMACGIPQVVSDWDGYRDLVVHGETGFLIPTSWVDCDDRISRDGTAYPLEWPIDHFQLAQSTCVDVEKLSAALVELTVNPERRLDMAKASRARARSLFDWQRVVRCYEELWTELHDIARRVPESSFAGVSYRLPSYFRCFSHYATNVLDDDSKLILSDSQRKGTHMFLDPFRAAFEQLDPFANWNLPMVLDLVRSEEPIRLGDIVNRLSIHFERDEVVRQVMWLLKYGHFGLLSEEKNPVIDSCAAPEVGTRK